MEDLIAAQINVDDDATDEEVEEDTVISSSDEVEEDTVIFDSDEDEEDSEDIESEKSYEETQEDLDEDEEDSEDFESENSYEETQEVTPTTSKDDKLRNKSKSKESLIFEGKTLAKKEITPVINKLKNNKNQKDFDKTQTCKDDAYNKQETKNICNNANNEDEYTYDTSDEEDTRNTVGNIPMKWYDEYDHLGYDWEGKKIPKPEKGDELDNFLKRMEDPDFWRTIKDPQTGQDVVLSEADIDLIVRIQKQKVPDVQFDEYAVSYIYNNLRIIVCYIKIF